MSSSAISRYLDATENRNIREDLIFALENYDCLSRSGIFSGSFIGPDDTIASSKYNPDDFWPEVAVFGEEKVKKLLAKFDVLRPNVHRSSGMTPGGEPNKANPTDRCLPAVKGVGKHDS